LVTNVVVFVKVKIHFSEKNNRSGHMENWTFLKMSKIEKSFRDLPKMTQ
jgi:hypothetical protein